MIPSMYVTVFHWPRTRILSWRRRYITKRPCTSRSDSKSRLTKSHPSRLHHNHEHITCFRSRHSSRYVCNQHQMNSSITPYPILLSSETTLYSLHFTSLTLTRLSLLSCLPFRQSILSSPILLIRLLDLVSLLPLSAASSLSLLPALHLAEYEDVGE